MKLPRNIADWKPFHKLSYDRKVTNLIRRGYTVGMAEAHAEYLTRQQFLTRSEEDAERE